MLDLKKLESELDSFIAIQTVETYSEILRRLNEEQLVKLSGGYPSNFDCPTTVVVSKSKVMESDCDFSQQNLNLAA